MEKHGCSNHPVIVTLGALASVATILVFVLGGDLPRIVGRRANPANPSTASDAASQQTTSSHAETEASTPPEVLALGSWDGEIQIWPDTSDVNTDSTFSADASLFISEEHEGLFLMSVDGKGKCAMLVRVEPESNGITLRPKDARVDPESLCQRAGLAHFRFAKKGHRVLLVRTDAIPGMSLPEGWACSLELSRHRWKCVDQKEQRPDAASLPDASVFIVNRRDEPVEVYKLGAHGDREYQFTLNSGEKRYVRSHAWDRWLVTDPSGNCLRYFLAPDEVEIDRETL